jgi:hypothetical protein
LRIVPLTKPSLRVPDHMIADFERSFHNRSP